MQKHDKRQTKSGGAILKLELMDQFNTVIEANFFNDAAEIFDARLQEGKVYDFSNGSVKSANKRFSSCKNDLCLFFERNSDIVEVEDSGVIPN